MKIGVAIKLLRVALFVGVATLCCQPTVGAAKRSKKAKADTTAVEAKKQTAAYDKLFKDKKYKTVKGLLTLHKIENKLYIELPLTLVNRDLLMGTCVDKISDPQESSLGAQPSAPVHVLFDKTDSLVLLRKVDASWVSDSREGVAKALQSSNIPAVMNAYPIITFSPDSSAVVFEATSLFVGDDKSLSPLDPNAYNSMMGYVVRKPSFVGDNSAVCDVAAFADNVSITSYLSYKVSLYLFGAFLIVKDKPLTAHVKRTFMLLPDEQMAIKEADSRIGTKFSRYNKYSEGTQGTKPVYYANRWRLEPADSSAWAKGELSDPVKPIVFYVDNNFPTKWVEAIENSVAHWNRTFESVGFRNAVQTQIFPLSDSTFDATNVKYSCIRYALSPGENVSDNILCDPRTGEILCANIYVNHKYPAALQRDRFLQTASFDPRAREISLSDSLLVESMSAGLLRNIGRCLGIEDNLIASTTYPSDSLLKASFTAKYGISPSVMDDLPYNYLLSADEFARGAATAQNRPGGYDRFVIKWLYAQAPDKSNESAKNKGGIDNVLATDDGWQYRYGKRQSPKAFYDPRSMSYDLGDNAVRSVEKGMQNLATVIASADKWLNAQDSDYIYRSTIYDYVFNSMFEYVKYAFVNVGGIYINEKYVGDQNPTYVPVPKKVQQQSLKWAIGCIDKLDWIDNRDLISTSGLTGSVADFCQKFFSQFVFTQIYSMWLSESKSADPYTQQQAMTDVSTIIWKDALAGKSPSKAFLTMQSYQVANLIAWSGVNANSKSSSQFSSAIGIGFADAAPELMKFIGSLPVEMQQQDVLSSREAMNQLKGVGYQTEANKEHIWYGMMDDVKQKAVRAASIAKTDALRDHYNYIVYTIDKALKPINK